ncbi:unnamed protein product [Prorocentrum cordatum]|uniref:Uncharacterized protein n=1 Tax=Prorocentrum cordatum TaxID=2364126 RepID=A0ABN9V2E2_9DINO|nr:unnamed protein product [Polarella glacialis]
MGTRRQAAQDGGAGARWGDAAAGAADDDGWRGGGAGGAAGAGDAMAVAEQLSIVRSDGATSNNRGADEDEDLFAAARGMKLFHISDVDVRPPPHTMDRSGMAPLPGWNGNVGRQRVER